MRISVVTPSFNQGHFIEDTIKSVLEQNYSDFEHIVMDAGSTDNTVDILSRYPHLIWKSEPDRGQSHAINKGFEIVTGDIVAWLNSDDYYDKNVFNTVSEYFEQHPDVNIVYGDITYIDENKNILFGITGSEISYKNLCKAPDIIRQPSMFWRKKVIDDIGYINEKYKVVMDLDYFLRVGKKNEFSYIPQNLSYFRTYPANKTRSLQKMQAKEMFEVYKSNGIKIDFWLLKLIAGRYIFANKVLKNIKDFLFPKGIYVREK